MASRAILEKLRGVQVTTVTPFTESGEVDLEAVRRNARFLVDRGIPILIPNGNTGEFHALTLDECKAVLDATLEEVGGRATVVGCGSYSTKTAIELGRHAQQAGADAFMVHHPAHTFMSEEGLVEYYTRIADALEIGVVIYKRRPDVSDEVLARVVTHPNIVGVKYAVNDLNAFTNLVKRLPGAEVVWSCGTAERFAPFFFLGGAVAYTSGIANFAPELTLAMWRALQAGRWDEVMSVRQQILPFEQLRARHDSAYNVPAVKEAMRQLGLDTGVVREPITPIDPADREEVTKILAAWGITKESVQTPKTA